jgi:peroxin-5
LIIPPSPKSVLELEAAVQRDPTNARAWFDLGVKQQENEREQKALQALRRAVELDPEHLPAWLALSVSHTNDGNRVATYDAIREWVARNERYAGAVRTFWEQVEPGENVVGEGGTLGALAPTGERFAQLVQCLIAMARSEGGAEVDADIQIALAVLLNTIEVSGFYFGGSLFLVAYGDRV